MMLNIKPGFFSFIYRVSGWDRSLRTSRKLIISTGPLSLSGTYDVFISRCLEDPAVVLCECVSHAQIYSIALISVPGTLALIN
jgi:hypothetical protein